MFVATRNEANDVFRTTSSITVQRMFVEAHRKQLELLMLLFVGSPLREPTTNNNIKSHMPSPASARSHRIVKTDHYCSRDETTCDNVPF